MRFSVCFHLLIGVSSLKKLGGHLQIYSTFLFQRHVPEGKFHAGKDRCVQKYILWRISTAFYTFQHKTNRKECDLVSPLTKAKKTGERKRKTDIWNHWCQSYITDEHISFLKLPHHRGVIRCGAVPVPSPLAFDVFRLEYQQDSKVSTGRAHTEGTSPWTRGHTMKLSILRQAFPRK